MSSTDQSSCENSGVAPNGSAGASDAHAQTRVQDLIDLNEYYRDRSAGTNDGRIQTHTHDPDYYYLDGTAVFLVESILFKIHASLILPPDSILSSPEGGGQRYPTGVDYLPPQLTDSSDISPIILPNVAASQFRNYVFALLGSPSDPRYLALLTDAKDTSKHSRDLLIQYLDISCLARQFGKVELEDWARTQLRLVLESMYDLAQSNWDKDTLLRLNSYAHSTMIDEFISSTRTLIEYFISISTGSTSEQDPVSPNMDTCVQMYRDPNISNDDPALFGCVFAAILSLGHHSSVWTSTLTQREKAVLYAAQAQLTSISDELESVDWLHSKDDYLLQMEGICEHCQSQLEDMWQISFEKCMGLKSTLPLQDVTALAQLPQYRQILVSRWSSPAGACGIVTVRPRRQAQDSQAGSFVSAVVRVALRPYAGRQADGIECSKLKLPLADIDHRIQMIYEELAHRHGDLVLEV